MIAVVGETVRLVLTVKRTEAAPAGITTVAGTVTPVAGLVTESATVRPPTGAFALIVTVPVLARPRTTLAREKVTVRNVGAVMSSDVDDVYE